VIIVDEVERDMKKTLDHYREELKKLRTNRPSPSMLDDVGISVYGTEIRLRELATVSVVDGNQLVISPFDPQNVHPIFKGIEKANLGLLPTVDGGIVRIAIPPMSEERRLEIVREAKDRGEKAKIAIREWRRKAKELLKVQKADGDISEDIQKKSEKSIQKLTEQFCKDIDACFHLKEKDILEV